MKAPALALTLVTLCSANSWADTTRRHCDYHIHASVGGNKKLIEGSFVQGVGEAKKGLGGSDERNARHDARNAVEKCIKAATKSPNATSPPGECKVNSDPSRSVGALSKWNINNFYGNVKNAVCGSTQGNLGSVKILVSTEESNKDIFKDCKLGDGKEWQAAVLTIPCTPPMPQGFSQSAIQSFAQAKFDNALGTIWSDQGKRKKLADALGNQICAKINAEIKKQSKAVQDRVRNCKIGRDLNIEFGDAFPHITSLTVGNVAVAKDMKSAKAPIKFNVGWAGRSSSFALRIKLVEKNKLFTWDGAIPDLKLNAHDFDVEVSGSGELTAKAGKIEDSKPAELKKADASVKGAKASIKLLGKTISFDVTGIINKELEKAAQDAVADGYKLAF